MIKKRFVAIVAAVAALALLAGCGAVGPAGSAAQAAGKPEQTQAASSGAAAGAAAAAAQHGNGHEFLPHDQRGGLPLEYELDGDVKVFRLEAKIADWEVSPGVIKQAWTYNGIVPGPEIRVKLGDTVRIHVTNSLPEPTTVHWHGLVVPNSQDGVPYITQDPIEPGETFTYEFTVRNSGTHAYHPHFNSQHQTNNGMFGTFIVEGPDEPEFDREYTLYLGDVGIGLTLNGKSFPITEPLHAKIGEKVRIRFLNMGEMVHPMHLHGMPMKVFARDGYPVPEPYYLDTLTVAPGERYDVEIDASEPGLWAFHCHVLSHAESKTGMHGMVTALIVEQ